MDSKQLLKGVAAISLLALLTGCFQVYDDGTKTTDTAGETIEIGMITPLSGEAASYGMTQQWVVNYAVKEINSAGGVGGKKLVVNFEDGGCDAAPSNKAASNLISVKKVLVILGGMCSSETLAAAPLAEQNKVVLLSSGSSSPLITAAGDYIFRNYPSDNAQGEAFAAYAVKKGLKKVAMLVEEQPYPEGIADTFKAAFEKSGGTVLIEKYAKDASDFRTQITKLQAQSPEAYIIDAQAPAKADLIGKQLEEAGVKSTLMMSDGPFGDREMLGRHKEYFNGLLSAEVPYDSKNPKVIELQAKYKAEMGKDLPLLTYMAPTYDAVYIIKEAIEKVGYDSTKIKDYLYTVKGRKGLSGTLSLDSNGDPDASFRHSLKVYNDGVVVEYVETEVPVTK